MRIPGELHVMAETDLERVGAAVETLSPRFS
jgi:hypothetical protein